MYSDLFIIIGFAFVYSIVAHRLEKTSISGPVIFLLFGFIVGPQWANWIAAEPTRLEIRFLADLTLAVFLFTDAAKANQKVLEHNIGLPARMLLIGLPGSIALGFVAAWLMFSGVLGLYEMALLAIMLAATDAALGKPVVSNPAVPERIRVGLNVESGLNDGLCVPLLLLFIALATQSSGTGAGSEDSGNLALRLVLGELGIGLICGVCIAALGGLALNVMEKNGWLGGVWRQLTVVTLALSAFSLAQALHGSGYVAAFVGGLIFSRIHRGGAEQPVEDAEALGEMLAMLTWIAVGIAVIGQSLDQVNWTVVIYAVLSLTVVRMVPIWVSLAGSGETFAAKAFMGWFGPRGLASIVFVVIVMDSGVPNSELLSVVVICTVFLSAVLHGLSANPLARALGAHLSGR